ncbi:MAG: hypothetical protein ABI543_04955 [Ignavibacteria bacterium]
MVLRNRLILTLPIVGYFAVFYKSTWLPGNKFFLNTSFYIVILFTIVTFLFFVDFSIVESKFRLFKRENRIFILLAAVFLISSFVFNPGEFKSVYYTSFYLAYIFNFLIYFIIVPILIINNKDLFYKMLYAISFFSLSFSLIGVLFLFLGVATEVRFVGKVTSIMVHPNFVPSVTLIGLFSTLLIIHITHKSQLNKKVFFLISFLIQFLALFLSYARDGMIAFVAGLGVFYFLTYRKYFLYTLPLSIVIVPLFIFEFVKSKGFISFFSRFLLLIPAYYLLISDKVRLLWGYGASNATDMYVKYKIMYNILEDVNSPHNAYISYVLMYGLIFTIIFLYFIFSILFKGAKYVWKNEDHNEKVIVSAFISTSIAYLVINLFESHLAMAHLTMMHPFLLFLGLLFFSLKNQSFLKYFNESRS